MKSFKADATSLDDAVLEVELVESLESVLSMLDEEESVAPIEDSALKIALTNPPPPGGGGGGADTLLVLLSESDVSWVEKIDERADNGIDSPEPFTALTLITTYSCDADKGDAHLNAVMHRFVCKQILGPEAAKRRVLLVKASKRKLRIPPNAGANVSPCDRAAIVDRFGTTPGNALPNKRHGRAADRLFATR